MKIINARGKILWMRVFALLHGKGYKRQTKPLNYKKEAALAIDWWNKQSKSKMTLLPDGLDIAGSVIWAEKSVKEE